MEDEIQYMKREGKREDKGRINVNQVDLWFSALCSLYFYLTAGQIRTKHPSYHHKSTELPFHIDMFQVDVPARHTRLISAYFGLIQL